MIALLYDQIAPLLADSMTDWRGFTSIREPTGSGLSTNITRRSDIRWVHPKNTRDHSEATRCDLSSSCTRAIPNHGPFEIQVANCGSDTGRDATSLADRREVISDSTLAKLAQCPHHFPYEAETTFCASDTDPSWDTSGFPSSRHKIRDGQSTRHQRTAHGISNDRSVA